MANRCCFLWGEKEFVISPRSKAINSMKVAMQLGFSYHQFAGVRYRCTKKHTKSGEEENFSGKTRMANEFAVFMTIRMILGKAREAQIG